MYGKRQEQDHNLSGFLCVNCINMFEKV